MYTFISYDVQFQGNFLKNISITVVQACEIENRAETKLKKHW